MSDGIIYLSLWMNCNMHSSQNRSLTPETIRFPYLLKWCIVRTNTPECKEHCLVLFPCANACFSLNVYFLLLLEQNTQCINLLKWLTLCSVQALDFQIGLSLRHYNCQIYPQIIQFAPQGCGLVSSATKSRVYMSTLIKIPLFEVVYKPSAISV